MTFASPEEAVAALRAAVAVHDKAALFDIFGPGFRELLTGDRKQDKANSRGLAAAMAEGVKPVAEGGKIILEIGRNKWPFPIPLVKEKSEWRFDTAAGKDEIINRHIGKDELHAIGICEAFGQAQRRRDGSEHDARGEIVYARRFQSTPGTRDGLYWKTSPGQAPSPFRASVAEADVNGIGGASAKPFHGYFFKVLTRQGDSAPGGAMNYIQDGNLTGGFALAAYPEHWGRSGIMTFIVDRDGKIYQLDLGEKTTQIATALTEYNPGEGWKPVKDAGVQEN
jgi:hypothetical protein